LNTKEKKPKETRALAEETLSADQAIPYVGYTYLLVVPQDVDTGLPAPEVRLVHDVIMYEGR
jgi:hypothetical protein